MATNGASGDADLLSVDHGAALVAIARDSLETFVRLRRVEEPDLASLPEALRRDGASFVTLAVGGMLRGCLGSVAAIRPLAFDVALNAMAAASRDPRFPPVTPTELQWIRVEVSVLTPPRELPYSSHSDLVAALRPGIDGVMLTCA